jgi:hypothetical protein
VGERFIAFLDDLLARHSESGANLVKIKVNRPGFSGELIP